MTVADRQILGEVRCGNCGEHFVVRAASGKSKEVGSIDARRALMDATRRRCPTCNQKTLEVHHATT